MKSIKYIIMAAAVGLSLSSCMNGDDSMFNDDWKDINSSVAPYGNNNITEENVITIAELKANATYAAAISGNKYEKITDDVKIKGRIAGNDLGGNIYKQIVVQDATGGIIVGINKAGLCGYLAEGQEILISLKGLYIGGYGGMAQIGSPYKDGIGRMAESIWMNHFKLVGDIDASQIKPIEFTSNSVGDESLVGKLVVLKNVTFKNANGKKTLKDGPSSGSNYFNQELDGFPNSVVVRTSKYADFAAMKLPYDTVKKEKVPIDIVGVLSMFIDRKGNKTLQIMIRKTNDIAVAGSVEAGDGSGSDTPDTPAADAQGDGTLENPFNAVAAVQYASSLAADTKSDKEFYIKGKVSSIATDKNGKAQNFDSGYGNATFFISDDGSTVSTQFQVFRALYLGNKKYESGDILKEGDEVVVYGKVINYKGNTPETVQGEAYLYSLNGKTE